MLIAACSPFSRRLVSGGIRRINCKNHIRSAYSEFGMMKHERLGSLTQFSSKGDQEPPKSRAMAIAGTVGAGSLALWGKGKYVLGALKLTKFASLGSLFLSIGTYTVFFGFPYAVGVVGQILWHETGHAAVMLQRGIPFSPMIFVPFVGAAVVMQRNPQDAWEEALIAFGGPVFGGVAAAGLSLGAYTTDSQLLYALAEFGYMINLFNLLPIGSMDGGRITGALSPYAGVAGLGVGGMLAYSGEIQNPIFYIILLAGGYETFKRFSNANYMPKNYFAISPVQRAGLTAGYFGLVGALLAGMAVNQELKKPPTALHRDHSRTLTFVD